MNTRNSRQARPTERSVINLPDLRGRSDRSYQAERLIPQSLEAEQSTLGAMMMEPEALRHARRLLVRDDFYRDNHRLLFQAMCDLDDAATQIDIVTLCEELRKRGHLERAGGIPYVGVLHEACPSSANIETYARIVAARSRERQVADAAEYLQSMMLNEASMELRPTVLADVMARLQGIQQAASREREGDQAPTISAAELMAKHFDPPRWVVPDIICEGLTILAGAPKLGKSWMVLDIALAVAQGGWALGRKQVEQGDVLYLALEDQQQRLQNRLGKYLQPSQEVPERLHFATDWLSQDDGGRDLLDSWLTRHPEARMVIVDTLEKFRPQRTANSNAYADDYRVLSDLKQVADAHHVGLVVVHHVAKAQYDDPLMSVSGSLGQAGSADATLVLSRRRSRGAEKEVLPGTLFVTGRDMAEASYEIDFDERNSTWTLQDEEDASNSASRETLDTLRIFDQAPESLRPSDIAEVMNIPKGTARQRVWRLKKEGLLDMESPGVYRLTEKGSDLIQEPAPSSEPASTWGESDVSVTASHPRASNCSAHHSNASNGNAVTPVTLSARTSTTARGAKNPPDLEPYSYNAAHDGHQLAHWAPSEPEGEEFDPDDYPREGL